MINVISKVRVGIIGAGRIGKIHTENLLSRIQEAEIISIADVDLNKTKEWANNVGINKIFSDPKDVIHDPDIDAVVICSPTNTHSDLIIESAKAKKHIFCEKPIDFDLNRIKMALKEVDKYGVKLQIGFNRRFDHNFRKIHQLVESGQLGDVHIINITSRDPDLPSMEYLKNSGGIFMDMTIHDFDMARYIANSEVDEIYASGSVLIDPKIKEIKDYDTAVSILKFKNGVTCIIDNSRKAAYGYDQRIEVFGSKGSALAYNDTPTNVIVSDEKAVCMDKPLYFFLERYKESFVQEMKSFINSVLKDEKPLVSGIDGLKAAVIASFASKSVMQKMPLRIEDDVL
ncbi:MAG: inositol 2-dehydrogenase [Candidatus Parvarchaeota archaeon]|nr:inositol 2-dehydrogenase [Candidatus Jingweiarchaeum tengchongense]